MTIHHFNAKIRKASDRSQLLDVARDLRDSEKARETLRNEVSMVGWEGWG